MVQTSVDSGQPVIHTGTPSPGINAADNLPWEAIAQTGSGFAPVLADVLTQFWGVPVRVGFFSASTKSQYFWKADDFHVSQLMLGDAEPAADAQSRLALLKLSDGCCSALLSRVLGARQNGQKPFSFKQLSPLEANILNEFSRDLLASLMKGMIRKPGRHADNQQVHLLWVIQVDDRPGPEDASDRKPRFPDFQPQTRQFRETFELGKMILSLPVGALRLETGKSPATRDENALIADEFFFHVAGSARIHLGSTRLPLADLNQLEPEDLVVLEESHAEHMALVEAASGEHIPFPATLRQKNRITIPYTQQLSNMETQQQASARQSLWDNLMIEVTAEFEPIKLPLKQIKQMSEGLVVEMGDLIHNQICLQVEGKTLAWGELIIVGDKFGVRIRQVEAESEAGQGATTLAAPLAVPAISEQSQAQPPVAQAQADGTEMANEENLDNFLNEDFDEEDDWDEWKDEES